MFGQKLLDRKHCVRRYVVMVQDPLVGEQFWPHTMNPLSQTFQNLKIKTSGWQCDQLWQTLSALSLCHQRNKLILSWLFTLTPALSWVRVIWRFPLHALPLCLRIYTEKPSFHPQWWLCSAIWHSPQSVAKDKRKLPSFIADDRYWGYRAPSLHKLSPPLNVLSKSIIQSRC